MTRAYDMLASIVPKLRAIRTANGYLTEAGKSVMLGPVPRLDGEAMPYTRLHEVEATTDSTPGYAPVAKFAVSFVAEAHAEQDVAANIMATGHDLVADLQKALFGDPQRDLGGEVLRINPEGYRILQPEAGSNVVVAQVRGNFTYSLKFSAP